MRALAWTTIAVMTFASAAQAATRVLIVGGLGGEPQFEERFKDWSARIARASATATGDAAQVEQLIGNAARREAITAKLRAAAGDLQDGDQFILVLVGHASYDGNEYRFNIPGPDLTGAEMLALLNRLPITAPQLVVNATSTSGAIAENWTKPHRVVVTATRSGGERNATRFAGFWAEALASAEADRDKDNAITAQEAFEFANRKVADSFKSDAAIATEHARISGSQPERIVVARLGSAAEYSNDQALTQLRVQSTQIESRLVALKAQKATLSEDEYLNQIEPVLLELARVGVQTDERLNALGASTGPNAGGGPGD